MHLKIKTPAKINLTLDVIGIRSDGYHEIESVMQTIDLYDYLTFNLTPAKELKINLEGTNPNIPYNEKNLVHKAIKLFYEEIKPTPFLINVFIEKNIPTEAGLGGGSANAAGTIWALNKLINTNLPDNIINKLCAALGSDLNICYWGGTSYATSRGELIEKINTPNYNVSIIKPLNFGISAKEGYKMFDSLEKTTISQSSKTLIKAINQNLDITQYLHNDLEIAPLEKYKDLQTIKSTYPNSIMTGSGSAYIVLKKELETKLPAKDFITIENLSFINKGIQECD